MASKPTPNFEEKTATVVWITGPKELRCHSPEYGDFRFEVKGDKADACRALHDFAQLILLAVARESDE